MAEDLQTVSYARGGIGTEQFAGCRTGANDSGMDAACEIRSQCASGIFLRELSRKGTEQYRVERHAFAGDCDLQDLPRAGAGARRIALFRMPHVSRLVEAKRSKAHVHFAVVANGRSVIRCGSGHASIPDNLRSLNRGAACCATTHIIGKSSARGTACAYKCGTRSHHE